jgi:hypothetical protein
MLGFNKSKKVIPEHAKEVGGLKLTIPNWMLEKSGLDMSPDFSIECKREGILISKLDLFT